MRRLLLALLASAAACVPAAATTAPDDAAAPPAPIVADASDLTPVTPASDDAATQPAPVRVASAEDAAPAEPAPAPESSPDAAACPPPDEIVRRLQARYDETKAFRAGFEQETYVVALGERDHSRGTVAFAKPGRMRWSFDSLPQQLIISDGTTLWIYQPDEQQVLRAAFRAAFVSTTPVSFLAGVGRITDDFNPGPSKRACTDTRAYVGLEAKDAQNLGGLEFTVDRETFDIVEAAVTDPLGNVTTLRFTDMERNVEIPADEFQFEIPDGVDVIVAPGSAPPL